MQICSSRLYTLLMTWSGLMFCVTALSSQASHYWLPFLLKFVYQSQLFTPDVATTFTCQAFHGLLGQALLSSCIIDKERHRWPRKCCFARIHSSSLPIQGHISRLVAIVDLFSRKARQKPSHSPHLQTWRPPQPQANAICGSSSPA